MAYNQVPNVQGKVDVVQKLVPDVYTPHVRNDSQEKFSQNFEKSVLKKRFEFTKVKRLGPEYFKIVGEVKKDCVTALKHLQKNKYEDVMDYLLRIKDYLDQVE